jgi:hypothetical protein
MTEQALAEAQGAQRQVSMVSEDDTAIRCIPGTLGTNNNAFDLARLQSSQRVFNTIESGSPCVLSASAREGDFTDPARSG